METRNIEEPFAMTVSGRHITEREMDAMVEADLYRGEDGDGLPDYDFSEGDED